MELNCIFIYNRHLLEIIENNPKSPENIKFLLPENNNILHIEAYFDKNPVGTNDCTILHFILIPFISIPKDLHHILLNFSDESLNKVNYN